MAVKEIPALPGEIARIRYDAFVNEDGIIHGSFEALEDSDEGPPEIPEKGIAIIFPEEQD